MLQPRRADAGKTGPLATVNGFHSPTNECHNETCTTTAQNMCKLFRKGKLPDEVAAGEMVTCTTACANLYAPNKVRWVRNRKQYGSWLRHEPEDVPQAASDMYDEDGDEDTTASEAEEGTNDADMATEATSSEGKQMPHNPNKKAIMLPPLPGTDDSSQMFRQLAQNLVESDQEDCHARGIAKPRVRSPGKDTPSNTAPCLPPSGADPPPPATKKPGTWRELMAAHRKRLAHVRAVGGCWI